MGPKETNRALEWRSPDVGKNYRRSGWSPKGEQSILQTLSRVEIVISVDKNHDLNHGILFKPYQVQINKQIPYQDPPNS